MKIRVAKLVMSPVWFASCPVCTTSYKGFYSARRWWLCMVWAREHIKAHQAQAETKLVCIELRGQHNAEDQTQ